MPEVADAHYCLEFIHLGVAAHIGYFFGAMDAKVFLIIEQLNIFIVLEANRAALNGIERFGGMETEHGQIAEAGRGYSLVRYPKSVCRIINYFQAVALRNFIDVFHITKVTINMYRNNRHGMIHNQFLNFTDINGVILFIYVTKYRDQTITDDGMVGRRKGEGSSKHLATLVQVQRGNGILQSQMPIGVQCHMLHTHICQPMGISQFFDFFTVFLMCGH